MSDLSEPSAASTPAPSVPGILFVLQGAAHVSGGSSPDLNSGQGIFVNPQSGLTLSNPGTASAKWYYIAVLSAAARGGPPPIAGARQLFATDDLPPLPRINQAEALTRATLLPGGQSDRYRPNGVEVLIGLDGSVQVALGDPSRTSILGKGQAAFMLEGGLFQASNHSSHLATYLSFFLLPDGMPLTRPDTVHA